VPWTDLIWFASTAISYATDCGTSIT
jgi:hypothetical protein